MNWSDFWYWFFDALATVIAFIGVLFIAFLIFAIIMGIVITLIIGPWLTRTIIIVVGILIGCGVYAYNMSK